MKRWIFVLLTTFLLVGCQPKEGNEDIGKNVIVEQLATRPLYESNEEPRELQLRQSPITQHPNFLNYYCWAEVSLDECLPELTENHLKLTESIEQYQSPIGYPITLYYETRFDKHLPLPDQEELFIYKDGTLTPVEIVKEEDEKEVKNNFYLPEEEGLYTYIYKATYDSEHIGVAYYMFKLFARHMTEEEIDRMWGKSIFENE